MIRKYIVAPDGMATEHPGVLGVVIPDGYTCIDFEIDDVQHFFLNHGYLPKFVDHGTGLELVYVFDQQAFDDAKAFSIETVKEEVGDFNAYFLDKYSDFEREAFPHKLEAAQCIKDETATAEHLEYADIEIAMRDEGETRDEWADKVISKAHDLKMMSAKASGLRAKSERLIQSATSVEVLIGRLQALQIEANTVRTQYGIPNQEY